MGCFHLYTIVNNAVITQLYNYLFNILLSNLLDIYPEVKLSEIGESCGNCIFSFLMKLILFSQVYHFTLLPATTISSYPLQHFAFVFVCVVCFFNSSHSNWSAFLIAHLVKNLPAMQETLIRFLVGKIPWRRERLPTPVLLGLPCGSASKESTCNVGDLGSIPGLGRSPGEGKGYPSQYSGLENSMDYPWGCKESDTTEQISLHFTSF